MIGDTFAKRAAQRILVDEEVKSYLAIASGLVSFYRGAAKVLATWPPTRELYPDTAARAHQPILRKRDTGRGFRCVMCSGFYRSRIRASQAPCRMAIDSSAHAALRNPRGDSLFVSQTQGGKTKISINMDSKDLAPRRKILNEETLVTVQISTAKSKRRRMRTRRKLV